jgi:hypothetical protein
METAPQSPRVLGRKDDQGRPEEQGYLGHPGEEVQQERTRPEGRRQRTLHGGLQEPPEGLGNDGNDHGRDPVEEALHCWRAPVDLVGDCEGEHNEGCRDYEADPGNEEAPPSSPFPTDVDRKLRGVRTRDEVGGPVQVQKRLVVHPTPPLHDLLAHHGHVRCRSPEGDEAQLGEKPRQLPKLPGPPAITSVLDGHPKTISLQPNTGPRPPAPRDPHVRPLRYRNKIAAADNLG